MEVILKFVWECNQFDKEKTMKKYILIICAAVLLIGTLLVCTVQPSQYVPGLLRRNAMEKAWLEQEKYEMGIWFDGSEESKHLGNLCYYGRYQGYDVIFMETMLQVLSGKGIGEEEFHHNTSFVLYAYKNGEFIELEDAYEQGLISDRSLARIAKKHSKYEECIGGRP